MHDPRDSTTGQEEPDPPRTEEDVIELVEVIRPPSTGDNSQSAEEQPFAEGQIVSGHDRNLMGNIGIDVPSDQLDESPEDAEAVYRKTHRSSDGTLPSREMLEDATLVIEEESDAGEQETSLEMPGRLRIPEGIVDTEELERIVTRVVREIVSQRIDNILNQAVEEAVAREIAKIKETLERDSGFSGEL
ncbi:hypothetical protein ACFL0Q_03330 [Thermodesulfobacteriota bacterium]